jgi:hypothetical protein
MLSANSTEYIEFCSGACSGSTDELHSDLFWRIFHCSFLLKSFLALILILQPLHPSSPTQNDRIERIALAAEAFSLAAVSCDFMGCYRLVVYADWA